jgi:hypothetical protein
MVKTFPFIALNTISCNIPVCSTFGQLTLGHAVISDADPDPLELPQIHHCYRIHCRSIRSEARFLDPADDLLLFTASNHCGDLPQGTSLEESGMCDVSIHQQIATLYIS